MPGYPDSTAEWIIRDSADIGEVIAYFRKHSGLTQAELAERLGVHRSYLSGIERGHTTEHTDSVFRALRRLRLHIVIRPSHGDS